MNDSVDPSPIRESLVEAHLRPLFTQSYIDSVELNSTRYFRSDFLRRMKANSGSMVGPEEFKTYGGRTKQRLTLHQPKRDAIEYLVGERCTITGAQIALDLIMPSKYQARELHQYLTRHVVTTLRPKEVVTAYETSTYYAFKKIRGPRRNLIIYSDRGSKPTPEHPCTHLELRVAGAAHLRALGLKTPEELLTLDHTQFWARAVRLVEPPTAEALGARWLKGFLSNRQGMLRRFPYQGRTQAKFRIGHLLLRAALDEDGRVTANDLAHFLRQRRALGLGSIAALFGAMDMQWMLPPTDNAMWRKKCEKSTGGTTI